MGSVHQPCRWFTHTYVVPFRGSRRTTPAAWSRPLASPRQRSGGIRGFRHSVPVAGARGLSMPGRRAGWDVCVATSRIPAEPCDCCPPPGCLQRIGMLVCETVDPAHGAPHSAGDTDNTLTVDRPQSPLEQGRVHALLLCHVIVLCGAAVCC